MVQITIFVDTPQTPKQANLVVRLHTLPTFVDAKNGSNEDFLKSNYKDHARFFYLSEFLSRCTTEELDFRPDFVVTLDEHATEKDWICVERFLEKLIFDEVQNEKDDIHDDILLRGYEVLNILTTPAPLAVPPVPPPAAEKEYYDMHSFHVQDRDTMLVQIDKPYCDLPYTVVIKEFSRKGYKTVFTDLFICNSWGVARKDFEFLKELWTYLYKEEPYDLDKMLHEATQRCFPEDGQIPEPEPIVYRKPIQQVLETLKAKEEGTQDSPKDPWNEKRLKKRKLDDEFLLNKSL